MTNNTEKFMAKEMDMANALEPDTESATAAPTEEAKRKFPTWAEREAAARNRVEKPRVDFVGVKPGHLQIHDRLLNWASWCRSRGAPDVAPGFELHQSDNWHAREYGAATVVSIDKFDAAEIAKAVVRLPEKHRQTVQWFYPLHAKHPELQARRLAVSVTGLRELLDNARQMLVNWGM